MRIGAEQRDKLQQIIELWVDNVIVANLACIEY